RRTRGPDPVRRRLRVLLALGAARHAARPAPTLPLPADPDATRAGPGGAAWHRPGRAGDQRRGLVRTHLVQVRRRPDGAWRVPRDRAPRTAEGRAEDAAGPGVRSDRPQSLPHLRPDGSMHGPVAGRA